MTPWKELATCSHYQTAVAARDALQRGELSEAQSGLQELIDALSRSDQRALRSQLVRLLTHVIKWKLQPAKRSRSWRNSIKNARQEIADLQTETPSLNRAHVESIWERCLEAARAEAEADMDQELPELALTWDEVFVTEYELS